MPKWLWAALIGASLVLLRPRETVTGESVGRVPTGKETDLHPELLKRWRQAKAEYARRFPNLPQPFLTQTYRSFEEQARLYAQGRTAPGRIVTNARPGESLHNYRPALAFDIAFQDGKGGYSCLECFRKFAGIAKFFGLEWGGDWQGFKDMPHFQPPGYTWQMAASGLEPFREV